MMVAVKQIFSGAPIRFDHWPRESFPVFVIETSAGPNLFEVDYEFAANGEDFWVVVSNFGFGGNTWAGKPSVRGPLSPGELASATQRIKEYFSGAEEKNFMPFNHNKARFLGVKLAQNWSRNLPD